ncbi:MAG TPA: hypothetical protein VH475_07540 [Tepidisphaeraceae bacterium]|jgi:hypothetical protein
MGIKASSPIAVEVKPFRSERGQEDEAKIGQVRNGYGMATAKVLSTDGDAGEWIRRALTDELVHAGFSVSQSNAPSGAASAGRVGGTTVSGTVIEFMTDMGWQGYQTRIRVKCIVTRYGQERLNKEFAVEDGGSGITGSSGEYRDVLTAALTKLMRKAVPDVIAAIER